MGDDRSAQVERVAVGEVLGRHPVVVLADELGVGGGRLARQALGDAGAQSIDQLQLEIAGPDRHYDPPSFNSVGQNLPLGRDARIGCSAKPTWAAPRRRSAIIQSMEAATNGASASAIITTRGLTKVYPGTEFKAVDGLDLSIDAGEIFGLLGPNGAGKTTTAGMLTTRVIPTSGSARLGTVDVVAHPARAKQLIGVVSQQNTLDRQLTVWENLYFHGRLFGIGAAESRATADRLLEQFRLANWTKASVFALSGGMAQRLMVARAIFHRPAVLFLDEPTAGLDPQSRLALWEILGELHADGQTIMLLTHYMEEADQLCSRVAIMDHGKILALDTPAELKRTVGADTIVTVKTAGDVAALEAYLRQALEGLTRTRALDDGVELHVQGGERVIPRVVRCAEEGGFDLVDLHVAEPSLETVFINLTGKELRE